jgi:hypothetical protein
VREYRDTLDDAAFCATITVAVDTTGASITARSAAKGEGAAID